MNKLRSFSAIGMPYHGLAQDGVLVTPAGELPINGSGGAVVVRSPIAPGANRDGNQQARDAALGYEWRNYALLCGTTRAINGGPELGANKWLYCDPAGNTWVMAVTGAAVGDVFTITVTRSALFGRMGRQYNCPDEVVLTHPWTVVMPSYYEGSATPAQVAAALTVANASCVVPNSDGSSAFLHIFGHQDHWPETQVNVEGAPLATASILTLAISGQGDPEASGAGVSCTVSAVSLNEDLVVVSNADGTVGESITALDPPWGDFTYTIDDSPTPNPPLSAGLTWTQTQEWTADDGAELLWRHGNYTQGVAVVYRTHHGDAVVSRMRNFYQFERDIIREGAWTIEQNYESVADGPGFIWQTTTEGGTRTTYREHEQANQGEGMAGFSLAGFDFSYDWEYVDTHQQSHTKPPDIGGGSTFTSGPPADFSNPDVFLINGVAASGGATATAAEFAVGVTIHPGMVLVAFNTLAADNSVREYRQIGLGLGESSVTKFYDSVDTYSPGLSTPPLSVLIRQRSFQPVDEVGVFGYSLDLMQYV